MPAVSDSVFEAVVFVQVDGHGLAVGFVFVVFELRLVAVPEVFAQVEEQTAAVDFAFPVFELQLVAVPEVFVETLQADLDSLAWAQRFALAWVAFQLALEELVL